MSSLTNIPQFVEKLKNLKYLKISVNELEEIPRGVLSLENLETLEISFNKLTTLPLSKLTVILFSFSILLLFSVYV
jgi:Leucine-rich repeat (LRR) protein